MFGGELHVWDTDTQTGLDTQTVAFGASYDVVVYKSRSHKDTHLLLNSYTVNCFTEVKSKI